jgi:glycosyltransferase involved in cell wall biosynthesis
MGTFTLDDLPSPPAGRQGWPWTEASPPLPTTGTNGKPWPRISLVTPSYNQAEYLEETIRSVLLQGYPNLEYFVFDGGSTDGSVEILRKYDGFLDGWVSERDRGQSDAINKGFARSTGAIVNWLCSDDILLPGALSHVGQAFVERPETEVLAAAAKYHFEDSSEPDFVRTPTAADLALLPGWNNILQPSCFFRRSLLRRPSPVRTDLHFAMDTELWCYFLAEKTQWSFHSSIFSVYRITGANKSFTGRAKLLKEVESLYNEYHRERVPLTFWIRKVWRPLDRAARDSNVGAVQRSLRMAAAAVAFLLRSCYPKGRIQGLRTAFLWYDT